ncbi:CCA tRNA nucleotidyltransferase, partial [Oscillatoriales cyanobacterium LEGE 11467]|nr:CCA tRNA nucleotidyltransferase [Zarconia navalis LEGE 11467]
MSSRSTISALSPQTWPFSLKWLPPSAYLVGGAVRDALLDRASDYFDLDFVLPENAVGTARELARQYDAGFVLLDPQRQIARVVFETGTVDFAQQEGETLEIDLYRRDFTTNAIAYNPHTETFYDPLDGRRDLQRRCLRMVARDNLKDDPLRLLRAYRQAAQLGFTLEPDTDAAIRQFAPLLGKVAAERVHS